VAALLPPLMGGLSIVITFLGLRLVDEAVHLSVFALNLVTALGLGLAIDYSLFVVSRFREETAAGGSPRAALGRTMRTAGRTVLFSSLTVAAALASLLVFPQNFLYSMGIGGAMVAVVALVVALLVLPAILVLLGARVNALAPDRLRRAVEADARPDSTGWWYRLSRFVMRRPGRVALIATLAMLAMGAPFLRVSFTSVDPSILPTSEQARRVGDALGRDFAVNITTPVTIAAAAPDARAAAALAARVRAVPGVRAVEGPRRVGPRLWRIDAISAAHALDPASQRLVRRIRSLRAPYYVGVAGQTAGFVDQKASLGRHLPLALAILALTTLAILFAFTGSVVLPIKALLMNLLTLSAAFGLLVLVFQDGRFESVLGYTSQGALESSQPLVLLAIAFGLSTDYGVFLLSRIKEAHDRGLPSSEAVAVGLERTGRIVTAAALLFCTAVAAFATSRSLFIKELGLGTAAAVLIDATIVRALLVPSLMGLLGRWNWWAPPPLRRLHARFGLSEVGDPRPQPG
jgi:RND superfamily putative drug exporter